MRLNEALRRERMEITVPTLITYFLSTKQTDNLSTVTVAWYGWLLRKFADTLEDNHLSHLTLEDARRFVASLQARVTRYVDHPVSPEKQGGLSPYTVSAYVRALKVFSTWLYDEKYTKTDLFARLKRPKLPKTEITVLTEDEKRRIFESINQNTMTGSRTFAIMLMLLDTGLRANELCELKLENVNLDSQRMKVLGKGNKERWVPFGLRVKKALMRYLNAFRPESECDNVFLTDEGNPLTYNALKLVIARIAKKAEVERLHLHLCRHSFAVTYLLNGGDLGTLREILGHSDISVTNKYLHLADSSISEQHKKFSPMDRMELDKPKRGRGKRAGV